MNFIFNVEILYNTREYMDYLNVSRKRFRCNTETNNKGFLGGASW